MPFSGEMRTVAETPAWDLQNNMISKDSGPFWCFRVIFAHQFGVNDDADPFSEVASTTGAPSPTRGVCVKVWPILSNPNHAFGYAYVFIEAIRDYAFTGSALTSYTTDKDATRALKWTPSSNQGPQKVRCDFLGLHGWFVSVVCSAHRIILEKRRRRCRRASLFRFVWLVVILPPQAV
jgi:hypothetical protein